MTLGDQKRRCGGHGAIHRQAYLRMVSKPDFDPNYHSTELADGWSVMRHDTSLLNACQTNGDSIRPATTFKVVTALDYFRTTGNL